MATLLHVFAHPTPEGSHTLRIAQAFLDGYRESHPADTIDECDLYSERMHHLTAAHMAAMSVGDEAGKMNPAAAEAWDEILAILTRFTAADKLLLTAPMWNFGVPSIMVAFVDHIVQAGHTFRFTGPGASLGLMAGRPLAIVSTRGGVFSQPPMSKYEMCVTYLRHVFEFLGFETQAELVAEGLALVAPHEQEEILAPVLARAHAAARIFDRREQRRAA